MLAVIRADRIARNGQVPAFDEAAARKDLIASNRLEGIEVAA